MRERAAARGWELDDLQTNHEGGLIDRLEQRDYDAVVINPAPTPTPATPCTTRCVSAEKPVVEIHVSNIRAREPWRARVGDRARGGRPGDRQGLAGLPRGDGPGDRSGGGTPMNALATPPTAAPVSIATVEVERRHPHAGRCGAAAARPPGVHPRERRGRRAVRPLLVRRRARPHRRRGRRRGRRLGRRLPRGGSVHRVGSARGAPPGAAARRPLRCLPVPDGRPAWATCRTRSRRAGSGCPSPKRTRSACPRRSSTCRTS